MVRKKIFLLVFVVALGCGASFMTAHYLHDAGRPSKAESAVELQAPDETIQRAVEKQESNFQANNLLSTTEPEPDNRVDLIDMLQQEIAVLEVSQIEEQIVDIKAHIRENNLVVRLNKDMLSSSERERANVMLARLALLGVEKAKRNLDELIPEMEVSLGRHRENLARAREILGD